jgi:hypothetical protein
MDQKKQRKPSRREVAARKRWQRHLSAQPGSGQNQAAYCRKHGLDPRYFSVWKGKLAREARGVSGHVTARLVPVHIRRAALAQPAELPVSDGSSALSVRLANGVVIDVQVSGARAIATLLGELARLPC